MNLMQSVVIVYSYFIVVQAVENIETTITLHEEYQSDLIDVCSKYKHGSWLTVRDENKAIYALCKDTSHGKSTAYFSTHTLNENQTSDAVTQSTITGDEADDHKQLLFLTPPDDLPGVGLEHFTKEANRAEWDYKETRDSWNLIEKAVRDYAEKVKVKLDVVSLERIATVRRVEFVGGSKTYITDDFYAAFVKLVMNEGSMRGYAFIVPDTDDSMIFDPISLIFALESKLTDDAFEKLPKNVIRCSFTDLYVFIDRYFIHHNHE